MTHTSKSYKRSRWGGLGAKIRIYNQNGIRTEQSRMQAIKSAGRYKAAAHSQEPYDDSCDASFVDVGSFNDIDPLFLSLFLFLFSNCCARETASINKRKDFVLFHVAKELRVSRKKKNKNKNRRTTTLFRPEKFQSDVNGRKKRGTAASL